MKLNSHLDEIARELDPHVETAIRRGAEAIAQGAKDRVPVDSGDLRDAIHVDRRADGEYAVVAGDSDVFYGHIVEGGSVHSPAKPFLIPAVEAGRDNVLEDVRDALKRL